MYEIAIEIAKEINSEIPDSPHLNTRENQVENQVDSTDLKANTQAENQGRATLNSSAFLEEKGQIDCLSNTAIIDKTVPPM